VVPMMYQDLEWHDVPFWNYFCQISDSTYFLWILFRRSTNEKITWGKLDIKTPKYIVESDATIVCPLIFAWILGLVNQVDRFTQSKKEAKAQSWLCTFLCAFAY
jgi:deoxyhypusine synthase